MPSPPTSFIDIAILTAALCSSSELDATEAWLIGSIEQRLVLASDANHFYDNMAIPNPFPIVYNVGDMLDGYEKLRALADGNEDKVIPGHDPQVLSLFPAASKELEGIAVALHEDPIGDMDKVWRRTK